MGIIKNELGHIYGDYVVIAYTDYREPSNGCIKWLCQCRFCGKTKIINGNNLRFNTIKHCKCKKE